MNNSLKAGIISGLIAGIISTLVYEISNNMAVSMGLYNPWWRPIFTGNILVNIPLFSFWGIILGIIYSKAYGVIPGKGIWKGLIYGLFFWVIHHIRIQSYLIPYGLFLNAAGDIFASFFAKIVYGLLLGILYEFLSNRYYPIKEKKRIVTYDMSSGILPGAIAGIFGGLAASVFAVIGHATGYWGTITAGEVVSTLDFWISQVGTHVLLNMIWGTIFGALFAKVYNLVPGKRVIKGFYYGLIMFLITTFYNHTYSISWFIYRNFWELALSQFLNLSIGIAQAIAFGIVLGLLYRKPSK
ncbi:MAG: hypothetical protein NWF08_01825 [Candidatus Bathyarchaeota archaeon]|nr:hypothetical protein [Candidatus Bathyarchaeota archaeon]